MDDWDDLSEMDLDDNPESDLEQMIDILIDHYGLRAEESDGGDAVELRRMH